MASQAVKAAVKQIIERYWEHSQQMSRSVQAGFFSCGFLALLAGVLGVLKLDTLTDGRHRRKLATVTGTVAAVAVALFGLFLLIRT